MRNEERPLRRVGGKTQASVEGNRKCIRRHRGDGAPRITLDRDITPRAARASGSSFFAAPQEAAAWEMAVKRRPDAAETPRRNDVGVLSICHEVISYNLRKHRAAASSPSLADRHDPDVPASAGVRHERHPARDRTVCVSRRPRRATGSGLRRDYRANGFRARGCARAGGEEVLARSRAQAGRGTRAGSAPAAHRRGPRDHRRLLPRGAAHGTQLASPAPDPYGARRAQKIGPGPAGPRWSATTTTRSSRRTSGRR